MTEIIKPNNEIIPISPVCSRCGMEYGRWELSLKWSNAEDLKAFNHKPGCKWTVGVNKKDWGPQLRDADIIPSNANVTRTR